MTSDIQLESSSRAAVAARSEKVRLPKNPASAKTVKAVKPAKLLKTAATANATRTVKKEKTAKADAAGVTAIAAPDAPKRPRKLAAAPRRRQGNKRSEVTIDNILEAADEVILASGADRISILEVCAAAGVSRGTFYRYFASQEELIDAISRHKRQNFHRVLQEVVGPCTDPDERFQMLITHLDEYLETCNSRRLLLVAPEFAMKFFKWIFQDSVVRFQDLLAPVFDAWDQRVGVKLDRELVCELIIRFILSEHLVGDASDRKTMPRRIARLVEALRFGGVARAGR